MKHKLVARYSESLGRKQYVLACGAPLEGQKIASEWRSTKCKQVSASRKKAIEIRLRDNPSPDHWAEVIKRVAASEFCCGSSGWRADFDWLLKPDTHIKVLEGKYDNRGPQGPGGGRDLFALIPD